MIQATSVYHMSTGIFIFKAYLKKKMLFLPQDYSSYIIGLTISAYGENIYIALVIILFMFLNPNRVKFQYFSG